MTDRMVLLARAAMPLRLAVCAALLSLSLGAVLSHVLIGAHPGSSPTAATAAAPVPELLSSQPLSIQAPVSAALGAVDPRYRVRSAPDGKLLAGNPAQRLRVSFTPGGVLLASGTTRVALGLRSVGFGSAPAAVNRIAPTARSNRVLYRHAGLSEWYANGPLGLEQGFTVTHRPALGAGPLTLSLTIAGNARAALAPSGKSIVFTGGHGAALRYGGLAVSDASGRSLHSWLELHGSHLLLRIDASGARYPLSIDPLAQQNLLTGGDEGLLGYGVALSEDGSTALVGAPKERGSAWVFVRSGSQWMPQQQLTSEEAASTGGAEGCGEGSEEFEECAGFGRSVALSADGNTALVGAPRAGTAIGSARVFVREGTSWKQVETLTPATQANGHFGKSVALSADGRTALVGAPSAHGSAGVAWVFQRENQAGTAWSPGEELTGGSDSGEAHFGVSVALNANGTTALIGAPTAAGFTFNQAQGGPTHTVNAGAAWAFTRANPEVAFPQTGAKLTIAGQQESEMEIGEGRVGFSVALSSDGNTALLGARSDDEGDGAAWVFTRPSSGEWTQGAKLTAGGGAPIAVGYSVALSGDGARALLGSPKTGGAAGAAWLFTGSGSSWSEREELQGGKDEDGSGWFGLSVALSGDGMEALVGGPTDKDGVGAAWPFGSGPAVTEVNPTEGPQSGGNEVTIKGVGFEGASEVEFGANRAPSIAVNSQGTEITAKAPPGRGKVFVTVKSPQGTSVASESAGDQYTYQSPSSRKADTPSPVVKSVSPDEGPTAGGTKVTIEGSNFEAGATVSFGSAAASNVKVEGSNTITAVSPAESAGTVDVTVATPQGGTSSIKPKDQFTFFTSSPSLTGPTVGGSTTGTNPTLVALGFGPVTKPGCAVALSSRGVAVGASKRASVKLGAIGISFSGLCKGKVTIEVKVRLKTKGHKPRFGAKAVGTASFSLHAGKDATVAVKLNAAGRALLRSHHGRLSAKLVILQAAPGPARAHSAIVHLAQQKPRIKHKPTHT